jgi:hypothetical protein
MALKLIITVSKKIPGPQEYSSIQASCSIEGELAAGHDPVAEAAHLQAQAQQAVDQFLGITTTTPTSAPRSASPAASSAPRNQMPSNTSASRPYAGNRRAPAPATDSQLRFLTKLLNDTRTDVTAILQQYQIGDLRELSCKAAAQLIDELKQPHGAGSGR